MAFQGQLVVSKDGEEDMVRTNAFVFATREEAEYLIERFQKAAPDLADGATDEDGGTISYRVVETSAPVNETLDLVAERQLDAMEEDLDRGEIDGLPDGIMVVDIEALANGDINLDLGGEG